MSRQSPSGPTPAGLECALVSVIPAVGVRSRKPPFVQISKGGSFAHQKRTSGFFWRFPKGRQSSTLRKYDPAPCGGLSVSKFARLGVSKGCGTLRPSNVSPAPKAGNSWSPYGVY